MKLVVNTENDSKVIDDSGHDMFKGTREECVLWIADRIEDNLSRNKSRKNKVKR